MNRKHQTEIFLSALGSPPWTFQTFADGFTAPNLARIFHGTLDEHYQALTALNERGAGVFVAVNRTDGNGRRKENVTQVRAVFIDSDDGEINTYELGLPKPSMCVRSSERGYHYYWLVDECQLDWFPTIQEGLAERCGTDRHVSDLPRVMRLPGFFHRKREPWLSELVFAYEHPRFNAGKILSILGIRIGDRQPCNRQATSDDIINNGERNIRLTAIAGALRKTGLITDEIYWVLDRVNARRAQPPLHDREVRAIARSVSRYPIAPITELQEVETMGDTIPLGGLWKNTSKNGMTYLSGYLGEAKIMIFPVKDKKNDRSPDYKMVLAPKPPKQDSRERRQEPDPKPAEEYRDPAPQDDLPF